MNKSKLQHQLENKRELKANLKVFCSFFLRQSC